MSFLAKLIIDENSMNVLDCSFGFEQGADHTGRPSQHPRGGKINVLIETNKKTDFFEWITSPNSKKNGEILFYKRDNLSGLKNIKFTDAFCLNYQESFNANDGDPLKTRLLISAKEISVNNTEYKNLWPVKN
jgi:hypothetical protein